MKFLLFFGLLILLPLSSYAQTPSNTTDITIQTAGWNTYNDPEGKFTIQYPSDIEISPKQNRFDSKEFSFSNQNRSIIGLLIQTEIGDISPETLQKIVEVFNNAIKIQTEFRVLDTNETRLGGNYAISQITYTRLLNGTEKGTWDVFSMKDGNLLRFSYISDTDDFDKGLPTIQRMLNSLKFLK